MHIFLYVACRVCGVSADMCDMCQSRHNRHRQQKGASRASFVAQGYQIARLRPHRIRINPKLPTVKPSKFVQFFFVCCDTTQSFRN